MTQETAHNDFSDLETPPSVVGGFRIGSFIGKGGVGAVYEGTAARDALPVAVKVMRPSPFLNQALLASIVDSALATRKISERALIVKILGAGVENDVYYIAMDLFRHGTLRSLLDDETVEIKRKLAVAASLAKTLALVHSQGIIHGDLKPTNILIGENGEPYLNDFYHFPGKGTAGTLFALPQGTPSYMSPEQAQGQFINFATDIYSFGVLLYELLTGRLPYEVATGNIAGMIHAILAADIIPPRKLVNGVSNDLNAVAMKLLARKVEDRYQSMDRVCEDLKACLGEGGDATSAFPKLGFGRKFLSLFRNR